MAKYKEAFAVDDETLQKNNSPDCFERAQGMMQAFDDFLKKLLARYKDIKKKVVALIESKNEQMGH